LKHVKYVFASALAAEMEQYLNFMRESGKYIAKTLSALRSLDKYLVCIGQTSKAIKEETVSAWLKTREVGSVTKVQDCAHVKGFCVYLSSLGYEALCPEKPKLKSDYVPYIFSDEEFERMVSAADNFEIDRLLSRAAILFPVLLRLLYGCGLRLGEGLSLRWRDVDLANGILTIRSAKYAKQRFVPMDPSLAGILSVTCREKRE